MNLTLEQHVEIDALNVALAEVSTAKAVPGSLGGRYTISFKGDNIDRATIMKARRLSAMHLYGVAVPVTCDTHEIPGRPEAWDRCAKVGVASALLGATCGERP